MELVEKMVARMSFISFLLALLHVAQGPGIDHDGAVFERLVAEGPATDPNGHV